MVKPVEGGFILAGGGLVSPPARCSSKPDNVAHKSGCDRKKTVLNKSVLEHTAAAFKYLDIYLVRI